MFLAAVIFLGGFLLAGALPPALSENVIHLQGQLTLLAFLIILIFPFYRSAILQPAFNESRTEASFKRLSTTQYLLSLFTLQGTLFYISLLFFYTMESMTRWSPRLQPLREGQLFEIMQNHFFEHSFIPWVLYSIMGVGLAYFTIYEGRYPTLPKMVFPKPRRSLQWFIHNYLHIGVDAVMLAPFIWLLPLGMIWLCEGLNTLCGQTSLFEYPIRSIIILGLLCIYFNRPHRRLLEAMERLKIPMGTMLVIYVLMGSICLFLLHVVSSWFIASLGNPETQIAKSIISQSLTEEMQDKRLAILIWSWWALWLPWMASQIARLSLGRKLWIACLAPLILPSVFWMRMATGSWFVSLEYDG